MNNVQANGVVDEALKEALKEAAWGSVDRIPWWDIYEKLVYAVDRAVDEAVEGATFTAMRNGSLHPGLQDFLLVVRES